MKERILYNWHFMRVLQAALALWFLYTAVTGHEAMAWLAAAFFGVQALFNVGCCGAAGCATAPSKPLASEADRGITYEEVK